MKHDPKLQHCSCGYHWEPTLFQKMVMLVFGRYVKYCPRCQCRMTLRLYSFVVCKEREPVDKQSLWKRS